ncbi:MAG: ModD protein [Marinospirillum sp.]|uniref:ModD protein n=1 Tax=Marinospirillum sp. TaxID=2183934 RepID=UPI001A0591CF|nr:ModD protein [Marinospirillum sp.]MBE0507988.1 ModD protein [Marinospirillum sp.]
MKTLNDAQLLALLQEDLPHGDLTTDNLALQQRQGRMTFKARHAMCVSAVEEAVRLLQLLGCVVQSEVASGTALQPGDLILRAEGSAPVLLAGWKVTQTLVEWSSGISSCAAEIVAAATKVTPDITVACTRKAVPGTRRWSMQAIRDGGAQLHRSGLSETLLLFPEHRAFATGPETLQQQIQTLRQRCPERRLVVEVTSIQDALKAAEWGAEVIQAEKFTLGDLRHLAQQLQAWPQVHLAAAGGINAANAAAYAASGATILVTSAPYTAAPRDVSVSIQES